MTPRIMGLALAFMLALAMSGCASLPSVEKQTQSLGHEAFSPAYRIAVASTQWKPSVASYGSSSIVEGLVNMAFSKGLMASVDKAQFGITPIDQLDLTLRDYLAAELPAAAEVLDRASYSAEAIAKNDNVYVANAMPVARERGYDGLFFVYLEPVLELASGVSKYRVKFKTHSVIRSLRNDTVLLSHIEEFYCTSKDPVDKDAIGQTILECYPELASRIRAALGRRLEMRGT